jgi:hypothetical protein
MGERCGGGGSCRGGGRGLRCGFTEGSMELGTFRSPADIDEFIYHSSAGRLGATGSSPSPKSSDRRGSSWMTSKVLVMQTNISSPDTLRYLGILSSNVSRLTRNEDELFIIRRPSSGFYPTIDRPNYLNLNSPFSFLQAHTF